MLKALSVMTMSNLISEDENSKLEDTGKYPAVYCVKIKSKTYPNYIYLLYSESKHNE